MVGVSVSVKHQQSSIFSNARTTLPCQRYHLVLSIIGKIDSFSTVFSIPTAICFITVRRIVM